MSLFRIASLSLASILFLVGCNLPDTQKRTDGGDAQGSFYADEVTGNLVSESLHEDISLPKERTYMMKACIRDLRHSKAVLNHPFLIEELNQEVKTDSTGCLTWNEKIAFEYLTDPVFIKYDRKIKSKGLHSGSYQVSYAINPWDTENYHNAIDLSKTKVEPLVDAEAVAAKLSGKSQKQAYDLWVEDGRMFVNDEKMGDVEKNRYQLRYDFNVNPIIKTKKTSGDDSSYSLKYGIFSGRVEIIHRYFVGGEVEKNTYEVIASGNFKDEKMKKGTLSFTKILNFKGGPPSRGSLYLRLYIEPSKSVPNLKSFAGVFPIGDFRNIRATTFLKVSPSDVSFKEIETQLPLNKTYMSDTKASKADDEVDEKTSAGRSGKADSTIAWGMLEISSPVKGIQLLNHKRTVTYPVHICFNNNLLGGPLAFQNFKVRGFSTNESSPGEEKKLTISNTNGCVYWTDEIEYDIYACRKYYKGYVIIENPDYNLKIKRYYYINPWDEYFGGKDEAEIDKPQVMSTSCDTENPKRSEVVLEDLSIKTHVMDYNNAINSLLEFNAPKKLGIELHPKVKVPSDLKHDFDNSPEVLIDGPYLLRILLTKNKNMAEKPAVIAQEDVPVMLRQGKIYAEFPFRLLDHRLFLTRNTIFLQLLAVKNDKVIADTDYSVKLKNPNEKIEDIINYETSLVYPIFFEDIVMNGETHKTLRSYSGSEYTKHIQIETTNKTVEFDFTKLVADFKAKSQKKIDDATKRANAQSYAALNKFDYTDDLRIGNLPFDDAIQNSLKAHKAIFDKNAAEKLCKYWFGTYWKGKLNLGEMLLSRACNSAASSNIKAFFDFDHVFFIKSVASSEYVGAGAEKAISLGTSFSVSTSYSESFTNSMGIGAKVGAGAELGKFASVGAELYSSMDFSRSTSKSDSNSIGLSEGSSLSVTESRFKIKSADYQYCISIKPNSRLFQPSSKVWFLKLWDGEIDYTQFFKSNVSAEEKVTLTQKGMLVCQTAKSTQPFIFQEQYYWVTQPQSGNEIQDPNDEKNKSFTIMIRGNQDYNRFKYYLTQKWKHPGNASVTSDSPDYLNNLIQMQGWKVSPPGTHIFREQ
mgnify:FL=1|jgi:hypothetical protein